jgi:hypothetical protein
MKRINWKRIFKIIAVNLLILLLLLLLVEFGLKRFAPRSKMVTGQEVIVCDKEFYFVPHPIVGYYSKPGNYKCELGDLAFNLTVLEDSSRFTGFTGFKDDCAKKEQLYMFGCSFTWGHGLRDEETMAYQLQSRLGCVQVKNYGIGAGSTVQSYLLLKSLIERGEAPNLVVVNYAGIHDERNAFKGTWRQMWQFMLADNKVNGAKTDYGELYIPYAELDDQEQVQYKRFPVFEILEKVTISDQSELISRLAKAKLKEQIYGMDAQDIPPTEKQMLSFRILKDLQDLCDAHGIKLLVTGIDAGFNTAKVIEMLKNNGVQAVDISVDLLDNQYNLEPVDEHPNALSNKIYSERIYQYLVESKMILP